VTLPAAGGLSLSFAANRRVVIALGLRDDRVARIANAVTGDVAELDLADLDIVRALGADLDAVPGFDLVVESDVPDALDPAGALEVAVAVALNDAWRLGHDAPTLAGMVQRPALILGGPDFDGLVLVMDSGLTASETELDLAAETATANGAVRTWVGGGAVLALLDADDLSRVLVSIDGAFAEHGLAQPDSYAVSAGFGARREPG
jgi:galactokinase